MTHEMNFLPVWPVSLHAVNLSQTEPRSVFSSKLQVAANLHMSTCCKDRFKVTASMRHIMDDVKRTRATFHFGWQVACYFVKINAVIKLCSNIFLGSGDKKQTLYG